MAKRFDIESYCLDNLDKAKVTSTGQITSVCPWCEKFGSFYIDLKTGHFICFKCEERGRYLVGVVAQVENLSWSEARDYIIRKAVKFRRKTNIPDLIMKIRGLKQEEDEESNKVDVELPKEFIPVYSKGRWKFPSYLKDRKIHRDTAWEWGMGFCNSGRYWKRIIIPFQCPNGRSFTARGTKSIQEPKYLNPPDVDHGKLLIGWDKVKKGADFAIVEGPFDAVKLWQHGIPTLALGGKYLNVDQMEMISNLFSVGVAITVMLDPEETVAPYQVAKQLLFRFDNVYIATLPDGIDPGSSTKKQAWKAYNKAELYTGQPGRGLQRRIGATKAGVSDIWS